VKFLVDAQLPQRLARWLSEAGHDALHTLDLPRKNNTPDSDIITRARLDGRIVVTKDDDFVRSYLLAGEPLLLLISTGNISNKELENLLRANLPNVARGFESSSFVEITREMLVIHE
jgi:predicted nuclease of predicted toxin-antitoxin system